MSQQSEWRFCNKCDAMFYDGNSTKGVCPKGGGHTSQGFVFNLPYDVPENGTAQANWRYCSKCAAMFFDGYPDKGHCPAGGGHTSQGYNFTLPHDVAPTATTQAAWRYCQLCHSMYFDGFSTKGACAGNQSISPNRLGGGQFTGPHQPQGFDFVLPYIASTPAPAPAPSDSYPKVSFTGPVWVVGLDHQESQTVEASLNIISDSLTKAAEIAAVAPPIAAVVGLISSAISMASKLISVMDSIGGNQGVDIQGVIGFEGIVVTPHASGLAATFIQGVRTGIAALTILDFLIGASAKDAALATGLGIGGVAGVFAQVAAGTPLGWALAGVIGGVVEVLTESEPNANDHGGIHSDSTTAGDRERFILSQVGPNDAVAILSWQGLFSAQENDKHDVYANRPKLGPWETWTLINNGDGTVSFKSAWNLYLTASNGGGPSSFCMADRPSIGNWEKFYLVNLANGHIAIKTHDQGTYLSVQPGT